MVSTSCRQTLQSLPTGEVGIFLHVWCEKFAPTSDHRTIALYAVELKSHELGAWRDFYSILVY
jgi:hypothetical protein